jgi:serine protease AprX
MSNVRLSSAVVSIVMLLSADVAFAQNVNARLGPLARAAAGRADMVRVIVRAPNSEALTQLLPTLGQQASVRVGRRLQIINAIVIEIPGTALEGLSQNPLVEEISVDRDAHGLTERTAATIGASAVRRDLGLDGSGIGVAVIDSGITGWHDDLGTAGSGQRVATFVDFINGRTTAYDDYGHGTHVAGIIAGDGFDSSGRRAGIAPRAQLIVLKALNEHGAGRISDVIAALDYVHVNRHALNIRVVNMSVGSGVYESYTTDPLTLATRRIVEDGIVVVAAAGNAGKDPQGNTRYGGTNAPGNAPWVLTVGASSHMGTVSRADDTIGAFSSRGPTGYDFGAKPDIVAPGVGIESLSNPLSAFYTSKAGSLLDGTVATSYRPYLSLTGTSMASPVVAGTVALMLQANPSLTPNAVKAILQYSSQHYDGYDALTQGAGFLNAAGAVQLARAFVTPGATLAGDITWTRQIIWANHRIRGGSFNATANAWATNVMWGAARTPGGELIEWGSNWGVSCADSLCSTFNWGSPASPNVVWGPRCGGADCHEVWKRSTAGSQPLESSVDSETVVWGNDLDTVVWGNAEADTVVWGNSESETVVWGNSDGETVVWGNSCVDSSCAPIVWDSTGN